MRSYSSTHYPTLFLLGFLLLSGALACTGPSNPEASAAAPPVAEKSEKKVSLNLSLPAVDGSIVELGDYDGKIRVVDFWATWCPPCRTAVPHLNELERKYHDQGVAVLGIAVDENPKAVSSFEEDVPIEYASLLTSEEVEEAFGGVLGLPSTFVLDREGRIFSTYVGFADPETLEENVQELLARK